MDTCLQYIINEDTNEVILHDYDQPLPIKTGYFVSQHPECISIRSEAEFSNNPVVRYVEIPYRQVFGRRNTKYNEYRSVVIDRVAHGLASDLLLSNDHNLVLILDPEDIADTIYKFTVNEYRWFMDYLARRGTTDLVIRVSNKPLTRRAATVTV